MGIALRTNKIKENKLPVREVPGSIQAADAVVGAGNKAVDFARRTINKAALPIQFGQQVLSQGAAAVGDAFSGKEPQDFVPPESLIQPSGGITLPSTKFQADQAQQTRAPEGNADALAGINQTAPLVNLAETATQQPGYASPEGIGAIKRLDPTSPTSPTTLDENRKLARSIYAEDGEFNDSNIASYKEQSGYISDNDPRMQKRRAEAEAVQARRMQFIEDSEQGKFSSGTNPGFGAANTIARPDRGIGIGGGSAFERAFAKKYSSKQEPQTRFSSNTTPVKRIPRTRSVEAARKPKGVEATKGINISDQIAGIKQGKEFAQNFELRGFPGLPQEVGQEVYDQVNATGMPITGIQSLLSEELTKLKADNPDADLSKNPEEIISLLKSRIRNEQSR